MGYEVGITGMSKEESLLAVIEALGAALAVRHGVAPHRPGRRRGMNAEDFSEYARGIFEREQEILANKQHGYTHGNADVLIAFKTIAEAAGVTPLQVCVVFLAKHLSALTSAIESGEITKEWYAETGGDEGLVERMLDARNYLLFLGALIEEELSGD